MNIFNNRKNHDNKISENEKIEKNNRSGEYQAFLIDLVNEEAAYQEKRKNIIDTKAGYLLALEVGILSFLVTFLKFPRIKETSGLSEKGYYFITYTRGFGIILLIISLFDLLYVLLPQNYYSLNINELIDKVGINGKNTKIVLLKILLKNKRKNLKDNTSNNDKRMYLVKVSIVLLAISIFIIFITNVIIVNHIAK